MSICVSCWITPYVYYYCILLEPYVSGPRGRESYMKLAWSVDVIIWSKRLIDRIRSAGDWTSTIVATTTNLLQSARRLVFAARSDLKPSSARLDFVPSCCPWSTCRRLLYLLDLPPSPSPSSPRPLPTFAILVMPVSAGRWEKRWFHSTGMVTRCARRIYTRDSFVPVAVQLYNHDFSRVLYGHRAAADGSGCRGSARWLSKRTLQLREVIIFYNWTSPVLYISNFCTF